MTGRRVGKSKTDGPREPQRSLSQHSFSRNRFLRLLGAGAGLSLIPASVSGPGGASSAQAATTFSRPTILAGGEYPIGLWWPPPPGKTTVYRYQEIAEAGFNFVIGGNGLQTDDTNRRALEAAGQSNLRFILQDGSINAIVRSTSDLADRKAAVRLRVQELLGLFGGYQALAGMIFYDEPSRARFGIMGFARQKLGELAPELLPYGNLYPSYGTLEQTGTPTYAEYVERYLSTVNPPFLSFDHYPLLEGTKITEDYFYNWALIRKFALRFGVPSWAFIQSIFFDGSGVGAPWRRRPSEAELRWQVNVSLAYGAKGMQYYMYWTPRLPTSPVQYGAGLVSLDGQRTATYVYAKRVNRYLRVIGKVLLPLTSESVTHAGESPLPRGATAFKGDRYVKSAGGSPVILGRFRKPGVETERYLFVANRSFDKWAETRLTLTDSVSGVSEYDIKERRFVRASRPLQPTIAPGGARLYLLRTG